MKSYYVKLTGIGTSMIDEEEINTENLVGTEAVIKTSASMISAGTELSRAFAIKKGFSYPVRPGYCSCGTVLDKGSELKGIEIGDRVFFNTPHASLTRTNHGTKTQGNMIVKVPDELTDIEVTSINLGLVALQGVNLTNVKIGDKVAVFGLGNIGIITSLMYQKLGATVYAIDPVKNRGSLAKSMGVKNVIDCPSDELVEQFKKQVGQADIAVDVTGISPAIINAISITKPYGQVLLLGSPRAGYETDITPVFNAIHMKNLKVIGGFNQTAPLSAVEGSDNSVMKNVATYCQMMINKDIDISKLVSHIIDPRDIESAYYGLMYDRDHYVCVVIDWSKLENKE